MSETDSLNGNFTTRLSEKSLASKICTDTNNKCLGTETDRLVKDYSNRVGLKTRDGVKKKKLTSGKCTRKPPHTHEYGCYK